MYLLVFMRRVRKSVTRLVSVMRLHANNAYIYAFLSMSMSASMSLYSCDKLRRAGEFLMIYSLVSVILVTRVVYTIKKGELGVQY